LFSITTKEENRGTKRRRKEKIERRSHANVREGELPATIFRVGE